MADERGIEQPHLAETIGELRVLGLGVWIENRLIEATEQLLEGVGGTFGVQMWTA